MQYRAADSAFGNDVFRPEPLIAPMNGLKSIICVVFTAFVMLLALPNAQASELDHIDVSHKGEKSTVKLVFRDAIAEPTVFTLGGERPRVVVDLKGVSASALMGQDEIAGQGAARVIRHGKREDGTRIVIDLADHSSLSGYIHSGNLTTINLHYPSGVTVVAPERASQFSRGGIPIPRVKPALGEAAVPPRKKIIVIDPGHGGYDPGALGSGGTKEKDITLKAALVLKEEFEKTGRYTVILTRGRDVYVALEERVKRGRRADADLFISLHADSHAKSTVKGASVYTLSTSARRRSTNLVSSQNWIMDIDLDDTPQEVDNILVDLAQRKTFSHSAQFADILVPEMAKVTPVLGNTHRRAGLFVLLAPDVPAVLVEMGYLSNSADEKRLKSDAHRKKIMKAIVKSADDYFDRLEKS